MGEKMKREKFGRKSEEREREREKSEGKWEEKIR